MRIRLWPKTLWPRTLAVQLIVVVAGAVAISNIGVAFYFYKQSEAQANTFSTERMIDRAVGVAATVNQVTPQSRLVVMRFMSRQDWRFREAQGSQDTKPMTAEEHALAKRISDALPKNHPRRNRVIVHLHEPIGNVPEELRPVRAFESDTSTDAIQTLVPIDDHRMMSGVLLRPRPAWPIEIMIAALLAVLLSSAGAAFVARRVVRPLSELTRAAAKVAGGSGAPHVAEEGPDDVRKAAIAFNAMAAKVTRTLDSQRHLLSAVGHDLRTPLTAMRINLEFVEDEELRDGLMRNLDELQALTEQVLAAAKGAGGAQPRQVDL